MPIMTPLAERLLAVDVSALALANVLGRSDRADEIRRHLADLRRAGSVALLAELATHPEQIAPAEAVRLMIDHAIAAGLEWTAIAAAVNTASERRHQ
jgi:hypothetical protein